MKWSNTLNHFVPITYIENDKVDTTEALYNANWRIIGDDEIVLKKSQYEAEQEKAFLEWREEYDQNCLLRLRVSELEKQLEKAKQETAIEILKDLNDEGYKIYKRQGDTLNAGNFNWLIAYVMRKYDIESEEQ